MTTSLDSSADVTIGQGQQKHSPQEHLRSMRTRMALRIQQTVLAAARELLCDEGFIELLAPIIGPVTDPGNRGAKQVDIDYYGHRYKLMTSAILYKLASLTAFDKIFMVAPNVRLEPIETSSTQRHLAEFHQLDIEVAGASCDDVMALVERIVSHAVGRVLAQCPEELGALGRDTGALTQVARGTFQRRSHAEVVAELHDTGHLQSADAEIDWQGEEVVSRNASVPFFIVGYPKGSRGFYDMEDPDSPGTLVNFDFLANEGYGEICSGGAREHEYAKVVTRIRESGENPAKYGWYLDMVRQGSVGSAGFGIGLERLTRWVAGLDSVWEASAFPKLPGVVAP